MMSRTPYIRLFVSSTFDDMELERDILQRVVFPSLTEFCNSKGWQFEDIDLRWGINDEASLDQQTMQICLDELKTCQHVSPRPNFLILQGDRYGWTPLPELLSKSQGDAIRENAKPEEKSLFDTWYQLDTNHNNEQGGNWVLQPRKGRYADWETYEKEVEYPLHQLFLRCGEHWMSASATEQEIITGALSIKDAKDHVVLYDRHLRDIPSEIKSKYEEEWSIRPSSKYRRLQSLRKQEHAKIHHILQRTLRYEERKTTEYIEWFARHIRKLLQTVIEQEIEKFVSKEEEEIILEREKFFTESCAKNIIGRERELAHLSTIKGGNIHYIFGYSGCGLSTLAGAFAHGRDSIFCSVGITHFAENGEDILYTIWTRLGGTKSEEGFSHKALFKLLHNYDGPPICIIIDGKDQLIETFPDIGWTLKSSLSKKVTFFFTYEHSPQRYGDYIDFRIQENDEDSTYVNSFRPQEAEFFVVSFLNKTSIKITESQKAFVREMLQNISIFKDTDILKPGETAIIKSYKISDLKKRLLLPGYLMLLCEDIRRWKSFNQEFQFSFSKGFDTFLQQLRKKHGEQITQLTLGLISHSRFGASLQELRSFLMKSEAFRTEFDLRSHHHLQGEKTPSIVVTRLLRDLAPFTQQRFISHSYLTYISNQEFYKKISDNDPHLVQSIFHFYDERWKKGDLHALYEIGHIANQLDDNAKARNLFCDFEYCIAKIEQGCSHRLHEQMARFLKKNPDILDFILFDVDAEQYCSSHNETSPRNAVLRLAAQWNSDSPIRMAYDAIAQEDTLVNTMGYRHYASNLVFPISQNPDETAFPTDEGNVVWLQDGFLRIERANHSGSDKLSLGDVDMFQIFDNECIVHIGNEFQQISFLENGDLSIGIGSLYQTNDKFDNFIVWKDDKNTLHIAYLYDAVIHWIRISDKPLPEATLALTPQYKYQLGGFLGDGNSLIVQALIYENAKHTQVWAIKIDRDGDKLSINNSHSICLSRSCQHSHYSSYRDCFLPLATNGIDKVASILYYENDSGSLFYLTTIRTYSDNGVKDQYKKMSACGLNRGPAYFLHFEIRGETLLHCSLDSRLVKYNVRTESIENVLHLPSECIYPHPSPNNRFVLYGTGVYGHPQGDYNRLIDYNNLTTSEDYYDSGLTTIGSDGFAHTILTSFGNYWGLCAESATQYQVVSHKVVRKSLPKDEDWSYSTAIAVSKDGQHFAYAVGMGIGPGCFPCDESIYVNDGQKYLTNGHTTRMEFSQDGKRLFAMTHYHDRKKPPQLLIIENKNITAVDLKLIQRYELYEDSKLSPDENYILCACNANEKERLLICVDLTSGENIVLSDRCTDFWWYPDSKTICFSEKGHSKTFDLVSHNYQEFEGEVLSIPPHCIDPIFRVTNGIRQESKFLPLGENIDRVLFCDDGIHLFAISETMVYLINWDNLSVVQRFPFAFAEDMTKMEFFNCYVLNSWGNNKSVKSIAHQLQLYNKGILMSNAGNIYRLEPDKKYHINDEVYVTLRKNGTYICPLCGHIHKAPYNLIKNIKSLQNKNSYFHLPKEAWEDSALQGYSCHFCGVKIKFRPLII